MLFDWKHFKIEPKRVRALFRSSYICHAAQESIDAETPTVETAPTGVLVQESTDSELELPKVEKSKKYEIRQVGGPYYDVISPEGKVVNHKSLHKSKAESYAAKLNSGANTDETTATELAGDTANG